MSKFFKGIGKAILYVLGFPFLLTGLSVACVLSLFIFLFQLGKLIFLFFTGRNLFSDLDEDIKAKQIIASQIAPQVETPAPKQNIDISLYPNNATIYGAGYVSPLSNVEEPKQEVVENEYPVIENEVDNND